MDMYKKSKLDYSPVDVGRMSFDRMKVFNYLRASLKTYKKDLKFVYAYLNHNLDTNKIIQMLSSSVTEYDSFETKLDYCFVYTFNVRTTETKNGISTGRMITQEMVWAEAPMFYTPKSLNTFAYFISIGKEKDFLDEYINRPTFYSSWLLYDYLQNIQDLNIKDENASNYWKKPENAGKVMKGIADLCNMYTPR